MSATAPDELLRDFLSPLLGGWELQLGEWRELEGAPRRYAVIKPAGGQADSLLRRPLFTVSLIGLDGGDLNVTKEAAYGITQAARETSGALVYIQASEPTFMPTANRRPVFDLAVSAITS